MVLMVLMEKKDQKEFKDQKGKLEKPEFRVKQVCKEYKVKKEILVLPDCREYKEKLDYKDPSD
jgi:hypothetical protein